MEAEAEDAELRRYLSVDATGTLGWAIPVDGTYPQYKISANSDGAPVDGQHAPISSIKSRGRDPESRAKRSLDRYASSNVSAAVWVSMNAAEPMLVNACDGEGYVVSPVAKRLMPVTKNPSKHHRGELGEKCDGAAAARLSIHEGP